MRGPELLQQAAGRLKTSMGAAFVGERVVFRGHDLHADLRNMDWMELYVFGITGRRFSPAQLKMLHALWVYTSFPDARLWNNRVAALAGTARSTPALGISAAVAVSEAVIYGGQALAWAFDFFLRARQAVTDGVALTEFVRKEEAERHIYGYGRPINSVDERLPWFMTLAESLGLDKGPYLRLALETECILLARPKPLKLNYAAAVSAMVADLGFSAQELQLFITPIFLAGMIPCFIDGAQKPEGTVFPMSCSDIFYEGPLKRPWRQINQ